MSSLTAKSRSFRELAEVCAAAGVSGVSLIHSHYRQFLASGETVGDMLRASEETGVRVVDVEGVRAILEPDPLGRTAAAAERLFEMADVFGAEGLVVLSNLEGDAPIAIARMAEFCDRAARHDLVVLVEPVPVTGLRDLRSTWNLLEEARKPNVGLVLDTWHFTRGAGDLPMLRGLPQHAIRRVQISDGPVVPPHGVDYLQDTLTNRLVPGDGDFDLAGILGALDDLRAEVDWNVEVCSSVLDALPPAEAASRAADGARRVLRQAGRAVS